MKKRETIRCADCGEDQDLSYIAWEGRPLCAACFAKAVSDYAASYPFLFAAELGLDILQIPKGACVV